MNIKEAPGWLRDHSSRILTAGLVLALLYLGRSVLIPLVLAIMLSLLVAPLVRTLRRVGAGRAPSVLIAVGLVTVSCLSVAVALGAQVLRITESLPQYETNVQHKLKILDELALGRLRQLTDETSRLIEIREPGTALPARGPDRAAPGLPQGVPAAALERPQVQSHPLQLAQKILKTVWGPLQFAGIVLLVLVFVLLEHESLRDRFIRIAGATDIRSATLALNDAGERLSRYFVSQFVVNLAFGVAIWASLSLLHLPQALLCGALAGMMRFLPYVGVGLAAVFAAVLAFAVDPGWSLAVGTLGAFILLDLVVGQLLEPHLYGHATGLSPLSVVVGAIFWSWLWGPAGLILSTPLTLCLLVAGRHINGLGMLELLLGNAPTLTLPQRFYQRALSGDPHEIIADGRAFLKSASVAAYCDRVLIPALHLARLDAAAGATTEEQQLRIRRVILDVASALAGESLNVPPRRHRGAVLDELTAGRWLRQQREQLTGRWQGPLDVPAGSIVVCLGLGSPADDLATELLARLLRRESLDARHFSLGDMDAGLPSGADPDGVAIVCIVSACPSPERARLNSIAQQACELLPRARVVRILCPGMTGRAEGGEAAPSVDLSVTTLVEAIEICLSWRAGREKTQPASLDLLTARASPAAETAGSAPHLESLSHP